MIHYLLLNLFGKQPKFCYLTHKLNSSNYSKSLKLTNGWYINNNIQELNKYNEISLNNSNECVNNIKSIKDVKLNVLNIVPTCINYSTNTKKLTDDIIDKFLENINIYDNIFKSVNNNIELSLLNCDHIKKNVIYTAIIGNYDKLKTLKYYDHENYDYICFTDSQNILNTKYNDWIIFDISEFKNTLNIDNTKIARYFKTHPHIFFKNYEKSIWIDGNVNIIKNIDNYINLLNNDNYILCYDHPIRNCIYQEITACNQLHKDSLQNLKQINNLLIKEKYPIHNKLIQSNILVRKHNNKVCIFLMEKWWEMIKNYSKRDQLSFNYIFWKYGGKYLTTPISLVLNNFFITTGHNK